MPNSTNRGSNRLNRRFLDIFTVIELTLKQRLGRRGDVTTPAHQLIEDYVAKNPRWRENAEQLRLYKEIRNFLTHQRGPAGDPVLVPRKSVEALQAIADSLLHPETVELRFQKAVQCVSKRDDLGLVLKLAFERGFSQFPVVDDGTFSGLITENEIVRWLGRRVKSGDTEVRVTSVQVAQVLAEKDPTMAKIPIFGFIPLDKPVDEALALFATKPALEVLLMTPCGTKSSPIRGIITQWDAARCTSSGRSKPG